MWRRSSNAIGQDSNGYEVKGQAIPRRTYCKGEGHAGSHTAVTASASSVAGAARHTTKYGRKEGQAGASSIAGAGSGWRAQKSHFAPLKSPTAAQPTSSAPSSGSLPPFLMLIPVATVALCVCARSSGAAAAPFLAFASEPDAPWNPRDAPKRFTSVDSADVADADVDACAPNARRASAVAIASVAATTGDRGGRFLRIPDGCA